MKKEGLLDKIGQRNGQYQRKDNNHTPMELPDEAVPEFDIRLPLEAHKLVNLYPDNVALVHGWKNVGKSSHTYQTAFENMDRHQIVILNVEAGPAELRKRLILFGGEENYKKIWKNPKKGNNL